MEIKISRKPFLISIFALNKEWKYENFWWIPMMYNVENISAIVLLYKLLKCQYHNCLYIVIHMCKYLDSLVNTFTKVSTKWLENCILFTFTYCFMQPIKAFVGLLNVSLFRNFTNTPCTLFFSEINFSLKRLSQLQEDTLT